MTMNIVAPIVQVLGTNKTNNVSMDIWTINLVIRHFLLCCKLVNIFVCETKSFVFGCVL